jgi:hypothetical protein
MAVFDTDRRLITMLRNIVDRLSVRWVIIIAFVVSSAFLGFMHLRSSRAYSARPVPKTVAGKMVDRLYDARRAGLKSLSFRFHMSPGERNPLARFPVDATVYWQAPDRMNLVWEDGSGKPPKVHPYYTWVFGEMYLRECLPVGRLQWPKVGVLSNAVAKPNGRTGYTVVATDPIVQKGRLLTTLKAVYDCDKNMAVKKASHYGIMGGGAPPTGAPHEVATYRLVADGRSLLVEDIRYGSEWNQGEPTLRENGRDTIAYENVDGIWLPRELRKTQHYSPGVMTFTFSHYRVNPRLSADELTPAEWPKAKLDLSSPDKTLRSLYDALNLGDLTAIGKCLSKGSFRTWQADLAKMREPYKNQSDKARQPGPDVMWSGFISGNAGTTSKIVLADRKQTDTTFSAHLTTVTTGRPVDLRIRLVREGAEWRVDNSPDDVMKGYD